jgi:hypothetical protein
VAQYAVNQNIISNSFTRTILVILRQKSLFAGTLSRDCFFIVAYIEGAEFDALCGAKEVLKRTKRIVMEFYDAELFKK